MLKKQLFVTLLVAKYSFICTFISKEYLTLKHDGGHGVSLLINFFLIEFSMPHCTGST